jgi:ParB-like chromosome segregation protein Spo0J
LLTADIAVNGVKVPLSVRGQWLRDGHHRFAVAVDLGLTELPVEYGDEYA